VPQNTRVLPNIKITDFYVLYYCLVGIFGILGGANFFSVLKGALNLKRLKNTDF